MSTAGETPAAKRSLAEQLLSPADAFSRSYPMRSMFSMYSGKLARQITCEGQRMFALAIWLEVDHSVRRYNPHPPKLDVNSLEGKSKSVRPAAVAVGTKAALTIHAFDDGDDRQIDWEAWCHSHNCQLKRWSANDLQIGSMLQANREQLLRCSAHAGLIPNLGLQDRIIAELKTRRQMTVHELIRRIVGHDEQEVLGAIAAVVLQNRVVANISEMEFDLTTELQVQHGANS